MSAESEHPRPSETSRANDRRDLPRLRRKWRRILIVGVTLSLGPLLGILGLALAVGNSFRAIHASPAPTPADLHAANSKGLWLFVLSAALGMLSGLSGACLALWSYRKLRALEPSPDELDSEPDLLAPKTDPWK